MNEKRNIKTRLLRKLRKKYSKNVGYVICTYADGSKVYFSYYDLKNQGKWRCATEKECIHCLSKEVREKILKHIDHLREVYHKPRKVIKFYPW